MISLKKKSKFPFFSALIVAAGAASRMDGIDKQQALIVEIPVVVRSIAQFEQCPAIAEIVVVCREAHIADYYALVRDYELNKVVSVVKGGAERQESVFSGIDACNPATEFFAIHDGARPLVSSWEIEQCVKSALEFGAAAVGTPVKDTIKLCDDNGFVTHTPTRTDLWIVRTPQIFEAQLYREAMALARETRERYTDDCQLVEKTGHRVFISPGSYENMKITTPEDIAIAQAILAFREGGLEQWRN